MLLPSFFFYSMTLHSFLHFLYILATSAFLSFALYPSYCPSTGFSQTVMSNFFFFSFLKFASFSPVRNGLYPIFSLFFSFFFLSDGFKKLSTAFLRCVAVILFLTLSSYLKISLYTHIFFSDSFL